MFRFGVLGVSHFAIKRMIPAMKLARDVEVAAIASRDGAKAAEAAREQGKFWQMHDRLFAAQRELSPETYERLAKDLGLDLRRFQESIRSGKGQTRIEDDQRLAARIGAQATPTMFVNGEKVEGAVPFATLKAVIDRKLGM